ncbi:MAG: UDP-N-acetylmuramoyl-tripeptide--D-alanyl-D-alanine ligase [Prevotella sp.]
MEIQRLYEIYKSHPVITTDSRDCPVGSIFIALKGESFDGNKFAASALDKGCSFAVIDEPEYASLDATGKIDSRYIVVDDCLKTFQQLALCHRRQFHIPVIGITGTNGKTTTKELVSTVLSERFKVLFTQGNFNNDVGVPKTLFRLTDEHEIAVVEMGASHPGDIKTLVEIVEPQYGLITNVGKAHLQGFGSFEGVVRTKGELYDFLRGQAESRVFVDAGNEHLMGIAEGLQLIKYGTEGDDLKVRGEVISCAPFLRFRWTDGKEIHEVQSHLIGSYNIYNMLAAVCIGLTFGVSAEQIDHALENYVPSNNRSQLTETADNHLIVDAYNANPTSMMAALRNFRDMEVEPKMAILGDMRELGGSSGEEHQRIVDFLVENGMENIWLVGSEFAMTQCPFRKFNDVEEVKAEVAARKLKGYYILIKGSNGIKLSQLTSLL